MNYKFLFPLFALTVSAFAGGGVFNNTGSLGTARGHHTATLLTNGKVLVAGGQISGALASAELYDPASGSWTGTGSLNTARSSHTETLMTNGKVLVTGGSNGNGWLASAELYDPGSGTWTATGSLASARHDHTATLLPNGRVLVAGGYNGNGFLASAELYDPASGSWTGTGSLNTARSSHTETLMTNGKVLVAGGLDDTANPLASAELYDPASGSWAATGSLNTERSNHTATLLPSGKVLAAGGFPGTFALASAELYDLNTTPTLHVALLNVSTRAKVGTGSDVLIAGVIVGGNGNASRVVVRAIGPSLTPLGVAGALQDPTLEIHDANGMIASNDDWKSTQQAAIEATGLAPTNDKESAILITLGAGQYTAVVQGNGGGQGVAVVEAYILD